MSGDLPLRDYALIGNCRTAALISRGGSIDWCCLPRFDSGAVFCRLLDAEKGSFLSIAPRGEYTAEREYLGDTNILRTRFRTAEGELSVTDFMPLPEDGRDAETDLACARVMRLLEVSGGPLEVRLSARFGFDFNRELPEVSNAGQGCRGSAGDEHFELLCPGGVIRSGPLEYESVFRLRAGERRWVTFCYGRGAGAPPCRRRSRNGRSSGRGQAGSSGSANAATRGLSRSR